MKTERKVIKAIRFWVMFYTCLLMIIPASAADSTVRLDVSAKNYPELQIHGDTVSHYPNGRPAAFRGFADPCIRKDPERDLLWLAYSWPHMQYMGGGKSDFTVGVETHLASSHDGGKTWQYEKALWPRTPARYACAKTKTVRDGYVCHEVPNIVPCVIDGRTMWVGVRLDYFLGRKGNYKDRENMSFCLKLFAAPTVAGLSGANPFTFGHDRSSPECKVDLNFCDLSDDFPSVFIPNEPALYFQNGRLYLAFVVMTFRGKTPFFKNSFVAVLSTEPKGDVSTWKWRYHGKLAGNKEAEELGGQALTQIELAKSRDGQLLAFLTPEAWDQRRFRTRGRNDAFYGIEKFGCAVIEVSSLEIPSLLRRPDGKLAICAWLKVSDSDMEPGAPGYDPMSATGILYTLRNTSRTDELVWSLHATGLHPPLVSGCRAGTADAEEKPAVQSVTTSTQLFTITVKGIERRYFAHVPPNRNETKKWPVVVIFHGGGGSAKGAMWETGWREKADAEGFLAVFPEGTPPDRSRPSRFRDNPQTWNDGSDRPNVGAVQRGVPDVEFVSEMLADLKARFSVDERRIYATGFSNGASMTFRVARELSDVIAAAAPIAGTDWLQDTKPKRPVPLIYITGTADPLNPIGGGKIRIGKRAFGEKPAIQEMIAKWVEMHRCPDKGHVVYDNDGATGIAYGLPGEPPKVVLYTIADHGHHWPGGKSALPVRLAGDNIATLNATDVIWDFFKAQALAGNTDARQDAPADTDKPRR